MKSVLIDLYKIKDMYSGLGHFSMNFAHELAAQLLDDIMVDLLIPRDSDVNIAHKNINLLKTTFQNRYFPSLNKKYDIWHSLQQFPSFMPHRKTPWILTIHDLNFLIEKNKTKQGKYLKLLQKNVNRADYITTISNYSKKIIEENIDIKGKKIHVIHNGVHTGRNVKKSKPPFVSCDRFFFSIGVIKPKKNFKSLVPVMPYFKDYQLIIGGNRDTNYGKEMQDEINKLNLNKSVILPGKISESHKQWLYENCEAFLFPSLAEGFGLPVIEAMYAGKPVFISRKTSLPEIGGDAAFYFDRFEEQHMVRLINEKMKYVLQNQQQHSKKMKTYARKFNWKNCMKQYLNLYKEVFAKI